LVPQIRTGVTKCHHRNAAFIRNDAVESPQNTLIIQEINGCAAYSVPATVQWAKLHPVLVGEILDFVLRSLRGLRVQLNSCGFMRQNRDQHLALPDESGVPIRVTLLPGGAVRLHPIRTTNRCGLQAAFILFLVTHPISR
jgi:hypothetical protein